MNHTEILVCLGAGCVSSGSLKVKEEFEHKIRELGLSDKVKVIGTGCMGPCEKGPVVSIRQLGLYYQDVTPDKVKDIVSAHFVENRPKEDYLFKESQTFFKKQTKIVLANCGQIDPESIDDYIETGGYKALQKVLAMNPEEVIDMIKESGLRGRGGAGFPTGLKWGFVRGAKGSPKYVICNADEGDPGAFMDRAVLEGDPHTVLEGMLIAGYAVGATHGYIYIRAEYPLAIERLKKAIKQARERGYLGKNVFGTEYSFDIDLRMGAGAFVCGEETALIASIEGKRGMPRPKPPFPANKGLWGKPTLINNVETLANIRHIILKGPAWFRSVGTEKSPGTKVFALSGKVKNTGLIEVPMGTPLGEVVFDIGGGPPKDRKFKAAQIGGPSGGCLTNQHLNTPLDYEHVTEAGAIMGSGGLIILDEATCMVELARFFLEFCQDESCGKCPPCRAGTKRMLDILERITKGQGTLSDIETLIELGNEIKDTALCGLGQTAPNPVLSTIRYFEKEYEAHIIDKKCEASVCAELFIAPCENRCPSNVDVPSYVTYIAEGRYQDAFYTHIKNNPFPSICGRVCPAPCEDLCRRGQVDEPVAIRQLKRFMSDVAIERDLPLPGPESYNGKKVAVVGAGPAGLANAFYLNLKGYEVTVFEALPEPGGTMTYAIPEYRLPKDIIMKEIKRIEDTGVKIKLNSRIEDLEPLRKEFDAIFLACGSMKGLSLGIPREDVKGIYDGIEFLHTIKKGERVELGDKVVVIGGGNTAIDAARCARRRGKDVTVLYRRERKDMPALKTEIQEAEEEGVKFIYLTTPVEFLTKPDGSVGGVRCIRVRLGDFDASGRRRPIPIEGSEYEIEADTVIKAIGLTTDVPFAKYGIKVNKRGYVVVNERTMETSLPGVFAGGDLVRGPSLVIESIADGRVAAMGIDKFLGGDGILFYEERKPVETTYNEEPYLEKRPRRRPKKRDPKKRVYCFSEVEETFLEHDAIEEARRCLHCDRKEEE